MKPDARFRSALRLVLICLATAAPATAQQAADARALASRLAALQHGTAYVRLKMTVKKADGAELGFQLQSKARRSAARADILYQILWPKERKGEAVLLSRSPAGKLSGFVRVPPKTTPVAARDMDAGLFGGDLAYKDLIEDFFSWTNQAIVGTAAVDGIPCTILESKPGSGQSSAYSSVKSWIDTDKLVPMRVEKYASTGHPALRLDTTRVANDDDGKPVAATLVARRAGSATVTTLEGSRSRKGVAYADSDFSVEGMANLLPPRGR